MKILYIECNMGASGDMLLTGIVEPAKVTYSALQNTALVASMVTTESLIADKPAAAPAMDPSAMGGKY